MKIIKIRFASRFNPTDIFDNLTFRKYCFVKFKATNERLRNYAKELEKELEKYLDRDNI